MVVGQCKHDLVRKTVQVRLWDDEMTARLIAPQKTKRPEIGRTNRIVARERSRRRRRRSPYLNSTPKVTDADADDGFFRLARSPGRLMQI